MTTLVEIPIHEEFASPQGLFTNYDSYDLGQRDQVLAQSHVDIRCFNQNNISVAYRMLDLDALSIGSADALTMSALESGIILKQGEQWTNGSVGKQADRNNWRGLSLSCTIGSNTTQSVIIQPGEVVATIDTVDIETGFNDTDIISLALPAFPLSSLNLGLTFIDFTSNPDGNFSVGPTDSISFTQGDASNNLLLLSLGMGPTLRAGDSELRFPRSLLTTTNKQAITGIRFRVQATANCTFRCMAIRLLGANWRYAPLDINTQLGTLELPVSPSGAASTQFFFPSTAIASVPSDFPIMLRADRPPGSADPRPIDSHVAVSFNTGSIGSAQSNVIRLFFRERPEVPTTMLNLDPTNTSVTTQAQLDALGHQPDYSINRFAVRTQSSLDAEQQDELDAETQSDLERVPDYHFASWIEANLQWNNTGATLFLGDQAGNGYTQTPTLAANTDYIMYVDLVENGIRAQIYTLDTIGNIGGLTYDTTTITDDFVLKRRPGRIGWYAHFQDGDALAYAFRTRGFNFAEARFTPLTSLTPVTGMALTAAFSPDRDLSQTLSPGPWGGQIDPDPTKSKSGQCFKVTNLGLFTRQGIQTGAIYFEDWDNTVISFDLLFPSSASQAPLIVFLYGEFRVFLLNLGRVQPDSFHSYKIAIPAGSLQTGPYNIVFIQPNVGVNTVWWIDNLRVRQRAVSWEARGTKNDPWRDAATALPYTPFKDALNAPSAGVLFRPGTTPQLRAKALKQNTLISNIKVQPKYAELGRFVWPDQAPAPVHLAASFSTSTSGSRVSFTDTSTSSRRIVASYWAFGDTNRATGHTIIHTYAASGSYVATHTVIDAAGTSDSFSQVITI